MNPLAEKFAQDQSKTHTDRLENDCVLWQSIVNGNDLAFSSLYKKYVNPLFNYGMHLCQDKDLVLDSLQELFANIWMKRESLTLLDRVDYYLFKSFRNQLFQGINKKKKSILGLDFSKIKKDYDPSHEEIMIWDQTKQYQIKQISNAMKHLSNRQREVILLKFYKDMNYQQVSNIMGISIDAVYNLLSKSIQCLRIHMVIMLCFCIGFF